MLTRTGIVFQTADRRTPYTDSPTMRLMQILLRKLLLRQRNIRLARDSASQFGRGFFCYNPSDERW